MCFWGAFGVLLGCFGGALGVLLGCFWGALGCFWGASGGGAQKMEKIASQEVPKRPQVEAFWDDFGTILEPFWIHFSNK